MKMTKTEHLTDAEWAIWSVLAEADAPVPYRELMRRALGRPYYGQCRSHFTAMRHKGVPVRNICGAGYYLEGAYTPPPERTPLTSVAFPQELMFRILTAMYDEMLMARARKPVEVAA